MEMKVQIPFQQLLQLVKSLTPSQKAKLKKELDVEKEPIAPNENELLKLLLNGPVATQKDLDTIEANRKSINQWRTNNNG